MHYPWSSVIQEKWKLQNTRSYNYSGVQESDSPYMLWLDIIAGIGFSVSFFFSKLALPNSNTFHETYTVGIAIGRCHTKWEPLHMTKCEIHQNMDKLITAIPQ